MTPRKRERCTWTLISRFTVVPSYPILIHLHVPNTNWEGDISKIDGATGTVANENNTALNNDSEKCDSFSFYVPGVSKFALSYATKNENLAIIVKDHGSPPAPMAELSVDLDKCQVYVIRHEQMSVLDKFKRGVLRVLFIAGASSYAFGFTGTLITIIMRAFLPQNRNRPLSLRALTGFTAGCFAGSLLRPACDRARVVLMPVLNRFGRLSEYRQSRQGYVPLFFAEDLPEFVGFMFSTPLCECYKDNLECSKGTIRSTMGMGIGAIAGEIFKGCSSWWCERTTVDVVRDELEKKLWGRLYVNKELWQEDLSLGFLIGITVVLGRSLWLSIEGAWGVIIRGDVIGSTVLLASMLIVFKISCRRLHGEPIHTTLRVLRPVFNRGPRWKNPDSSIPQYVIERVKRCSKCSYCETREANPNYNRSS